MNRTHVKVKLKIESVNVKLPAEIQAKIDSKKDSQLVAAIESEIESKIESELEAKLAADLETKIRSKIVPAIVPELVLKLGSEKTVFKKAALKKSALEKAALKKSAFEKTALEKAGIEKESETTDSRLVAAITSKIDQNIQYKVYSVPDFKKVRSKKISAEYMIPPIIEGPVEFQSELTELTNISKANDADSRLAKSLLEKHLKSIRNETKTTVSDTDYNNFQNPLTNPNLTNPSLNPNLNPNLQVGFAKVSRKWPGMT